MGVGEASESERAGARGRRGTATPDLRSRGLDVAQACGPRSAASSSGWWEYASGSVPTGSPTPVASVASSASSGASSAHRVQRPGGAGDRGREDEAAGLGDADGLGERASAVRCVGQVVERPEQERDVGGGVRLGEGARVAHRGGEAASAGSLDVRGHDVDQRDGVPVSLQPLGVRAGGEADVEAARRRRREPRAQQRLRTRQREPVRRRRPASSEPRSSRRGDSASGGASRTASTPSARASSHPIGAAGVQFAARREPRAAQPLAVALRAEGRVRRRERCSVGRRRRQVAPARLGRACRSRRRAGCVG